MGREVKLCVIFLVLSQIEELVGSVKGGRVKVIDSEPQIDSTLKCVSPINSIHKGISPGEAVESVVMLPSIRSNPSEDWSTY